MPVHHLLERYWTTTLWSQAFRAGNPCSRALIRLEQP
jgi:hypothetical protein